MRGRTRVAIVLSATVGYALAFVLLRPFLGTGVTVLAVLPVVVAAQLLGMRAGVVAGLLMLPLNRLLWRLVGEPGWEAIASATGLVIVVLLGAIIGHLRDLHEQVRQQLAERVRAEAERAHLVEELQAALQAKEEMIANVSHELRTPLTHISGYSDLLRAGILGGNLNSDELHAMEAIYQQSQRLARLVDTLLTLQTLDVTSLEREPVNLTNLVEQGVAACRERAQQQRIALYLQAPPEALWLQGDFQALQQALDQLLDNAFKFTPEGGTVTVCLEQRESEVWLAVADTGIGIPPDKLEQVFERFYQVDASARRHYGGMGIGLALVRHIGSLHGGRVWVESEGGGRGTTVSMALPLAPANQAR